MARLVGLMAVAFVFVLIAAAIVGHWRTRAVYDQLAEHNQRASGLIEHRSADLNR
jgi:hypothetical protein